ncbi:hypothetical protein GH810_02045 [Acetobacterium paludosum]|uniref:Uncharacterized protein n=1 Tax=Acetobacterium paludosum TaxID=52693 RepID=A0A923KRB9_9FIRM|nr:hypothetical protein [Acetobacterium paludosum]MBC3887092.1 hypothetical protein [Acetobacterium paludosum]
MRKSDFYEVYQANLKMLEREINLVKKSIQVTLGRKLWLQENGSDNSKVSSCEEDITAGTQLYTFLICSWLEARLMKMLYESSNAAFTDNEIFLVRNFPTMTIKWKECFSMAVCKSYGFTYISEQNYANNFSNGSISQQNYQNVFSLFVDIDDAITIRNRLAHGQWYKQFNSKNKKLVNYPFLNLYTNVQKLDILRQYYNEIADIISSYVTYKDKANSNFDSGIQNKIVSIREKKKRILNSNFDSYCQPFKRIEHNKMEAFKRK